MIRKAIIVVLSCTSALLVLFAFMMWTSESIWSFGNEYDQGTKVRVSFYAGESLIEYMGPLRDWWPHNTYTAELAWVRFELAYVGSSISPPDLELKSCAVATLHPLCSVLVANVGFLIGLYPLIAFVQGPLRRWRRRRKGLCIKCGYDLTGNVSGTCMECGADLVRTRQARSESPSQQE